MFAPTSCEIQNLLLARFYAMRGVTRADIIHSADEHGMVNVGHSVPEAILHRTGAQLLSVGTGVEKRFAQQVNLMCDFGASVIVSFGDYIKRLSKVVRDERLVPGVDLKIRAMVDHIGAESHAAMSKAWGGAEVFEWYGVSAIRAIAGEGPDHVGMSIQEDAQFIELLDITTRQPVAMGDSGNIVCTCLFKDDVFPIIRFNNPRRFGVRHRSVAAGAEPDAACRVSRPI